MARTPTCLGLPSLPPGERSSLWTTLATCPSTPRSLPWWARSMRNPVSLWSPSPSPWCTSPRTTQGWTYTRTPTQWISLFPAPCWSSPSVTGLAPCAAMKSYAVTKPKFKKNYICLDPKNPIPNGIGHPLTFLA